MHLPRLSAIPAVAMIATGTLCAGGGAVAIAQPFAHHPQKCATYYIQEPDTRPGPLVRPALQALTYFRFCGSTVVPGTWYCPVKPGAQIVDVRLACKGRARK